MADDASRGFNKGSTSALIDPTQLGTVLTKSNKAGLESLAELSFATTSVRILSVLSKTQSSP